MTKESAERISGYYVATAPTKATSSTIGVGDVIVRIQNQPVIPTALAQQIITAPTDVLFTVLRDGEEIDMTVSKVPVQ